MQNVQKFNPFACKVLMILILAVVMLPLCLQAGGGGTTPPPPDSSGQNNMIIIDTTVSDIDSAQSELSFLDSLTLKLFFFIVL